MKSVKSVGEQMKEKDRYFILKHNKAFVSGFLTSVTNSLLKKKDVVNMTKEEILDYIKDIAESLKQEKLFTEEAHGTE